MQGISVSLSQNGQLLAVGGSVDNSGVGATWIFQRNPSNNTWFQHGQKLVGTGASTTAEQGNVVAFSQNGSTLIVGAFNDTSLGSVFIFT